MQRSWSCAWKGNGRSPKRGILAGERICLPAGSLTCHCSHLVKPTVKVFLREKSATHPFPIGLRWSVHSWPAIDPMSNGNKSPQPGVRKDSQRCAEITWVNLKWKNCDLVQQVPWNPGKTASVILWENSLKLSQLGECRGILFRQHLTLLHVISCADLFYLRSI